MAEPASELYDLVELLRTEQRRRWLDGERVSAEAYFELHPTLLTDPTSALHMIYNEVLLREQDGENPALEDYVRRFPDLACQLNPLFEVHRALESDQILETLADQASPGATLPQRRGNAPSSAPTVTGYVIIGELGRGGMGVVYKAVKAGLSRVVALKMILAGNHADAAQLARFRAEAEAVARLHHPNIVQIYDIGEQDGCPYFSMEFVNGPSLAEELKGMPQPARSAAGLIETLARAIHTAHQKGIIHRDLKPANILLGTAEWLTANDRSSLPLDPESSDLYSNGDLASYFPKISDFGLAKQLDIGEGQTATGAILGTPSYMAPERANSQRREVSPAEDIYSLGAILYELLTGRPPFKASTPLDTLRQVLAEEPVPLSRYHLKVPADLNTICMKCLQKAPHKRYASALALAEDLERFLARQPIRARRTPLLERAWLWCWRNPMAACLGGLIVTAAIGAALAAVRLRIEQSATLAQLRKTQDAEIAGEHRLFASLLGQARASRLSRQMGQRFETLDLIAEAAKLALSLKLGEDEFRKLRSEAASSMALTDLRVDHEWPGWPAGSFGAAFDGSLERYARVDRNGAVSIRRVNDDAELYQMPSMGTGASWAQMSDDGLAVVVSSWSYAKLWTLTGTTASCLLEVKDFTAVNFSPDDQQIAFGHEDATISLHERPSGRETQRFRAAKPIRHVAFNPKHRQLAVTYASGAAVIDLNTGRSLVDLSRGAWVSAIPAWHPEGNLLALAERENRIALWEVPTGTPRMFFEGYKNVITGISFNHAGSLLASTGWEGKLRLWDPRTGEQLFSLNNPVQDVRFSRDDQRLALDSAADVSEPGKWQLARSIERYTGTRTRWIKKNPLSLRSARNTTWWPRAWATACN